MRRRLPFILQRLEQGGIETSCHATENRGDATEAASEAVERGFDIVISAGGDGTLNEVVNGLCRHDKRPPLGILPMGTSNDFARSHQIPKRWEDAVDIIVQGHTRPVDIGLADGNYFINIAGGGFLTEISYEVPSKLKTMIGHMAYYIKGFESVTRFRPTRLRIKAEGVEDMEGDFMLFLIANSHTVAGFDKLAPQAATDDGLFDVIVMKKCNLAEMIRIATLAVRGEHISDSHIVHFQTSNIQVESEDRVQLNLDGELGGELPCSFTLLPSHLTLLANEKTETAEQG